MGKWQTVKDYNKGPYEIIKDKTKEKIHNAREDKRLIVLLLVELVMVLIVVFAILIYFDPEINLVPFPLNLIGFIVLLIIVLWMFSFTKEFRIAKGQIKQFKKLNITGKQASKKN